MWNFTKPGTPVLPPEALLPHSLRPKGGVEQCTQSFLSQAILQAAVLASLTIGDVRRNFFFDLHDWRDRLRKILPYSAEMMDPILNYIEANEQKFIKDLAAAISIPSVSTTPQTHLDFSHKNVEWFKNRLESLGFTVELRQPKEIQTRRIGDGQVEYPVPPLILAKLDNEDINKKTLLVYGHIDVQPAALEDGWDTPPFELVEKDGKLYGRGSTDDKGPVLCWMNAIEAYNATQTPLPINIRFLLESMEESDSVGLEPEIRRMQKNNDLFIKNINHVAIADTYWMGEDHPCVTYGVRGAMAFTLSVQCASKDLHSGCAGGLINEAMSDLLYFLDKLIDRNGTILIPGIYDQIKAPTQEELSSYNAIKHFSAKDKERDFGVLDIHDRDNPAKILQRLWREPSLSIHGIEGAYAGSGFKTVIPGKVIGKFSIRIVPDMEADRTEKCVRDYIEKLQKERGSKNKIELQCIESGPYYLANPTGQNFMAARLAAKKVYGEEPYLTREGGSIPISAILAEVTGQDVCFICVGRNSDGAHGPNEKIDKVNYLKGAQMMAFYLHELGS